MIHIQARNVNDAYDQAMDLLTAQDRGIGAYKAETRAGPAYVLPEPVVTTYNQPCERVLFDRARRANPFFHLFESFWMLAGRSDAAFLNEYVSDFGERFAEDDGHIWDAYGRRWRSWFDQYGESGGQANFDQLEQCVEKLRENPTDRQVVLTMWDAQTDPHRDTKTKPCNTHVYFRLIPSYGSHKLITTLCCRSNDAVWGAYGANAVHFSVLHEYVAWRVGATPGKMEQLSNNLHVYENMLGRWSPREESSDHYASGLVRRSPLFAFAENEVFADELARWLEKPAFSEDYATPLFGKLLVPMAAAHRFWKQRYYDLALHELDKVTHTDWQLAARNWIERRIRR